MKANKEEGKRATKVSSWKKKSHGFARALNRFWMEECHSFFFYSFSQLLVDWDQNEKAPTKAGFIPRLSQIGTI